VNPEANPLYKVLRSLWFPMSVNAAVLGATAVVIFRAVSLVAAALAGGEARPWEADSHFDDALVDLAVHGLPGLARPTWGPGLAVFLVQAVTAYFLWAVFGTAMCRTLAVRIARDEYISMREALRFAWRTKATALLHFPAIALPIVFCGAVLAAAGMIGQIPYLGWIVNAILLPVTVLFAIVMQLIWFAGVVALGFTPAALAAERRGVYETTTKVIHYLFARPLPVVLYLATLGAFFWLLEHAVFAPDLLRESLAALLGLVPLDPDFRRIVHGDVDGLSGFAALAAGLHRLMFGGVDALVRGMFLSFAAGGFTSLFLLFRLECDGTATTELVRDEAAKP
jgi:hypothetical protein